MRRVIEIISTKRSAHHAFVDWIAENADRPILFFNNALPSVPPRMRRAQLLNSDQAVPPAGDRERLLLSDAHDAIFNIEGALIQSIERWNRSYLTPRLNGDLCRVIFLRDPVNCFASLAFRAKRRNYDRCAKFFAQFLAFESIVASLDAGASYERVVTMSAWQRDEDYRASLASFFGLETHDLPKHVTRFGGGSSFGGVSFDPSADASALFQRWRQTEGDPLFLALFADDTARAAIGSYFRRFASEELVDASILARLSERAEQDPRAQNYVRRLLVPLRRAVTQVLRRDMSRNPIERGFWSAAIRTRVLSRL